MSLVKINCYTNNYSSITGGLRASIYLASEPTAMLENLQELTPPHNARLWSFTGLLRDDYIFKLEELDSDGVAINLLSEIALTPTELDTNSYKDDFQVIVGSTNGIVDSATSAIFDGSDGAPDFRSWDVTVTEMFGRGLLKKGVDFTFNKTTGLFTLLTGGSFVGGQYFNFHFDQQSSSESTGVGTYVKRVVNLITSTTSLDSTYLGSINIVEVQSSTATPIVITLPDISTVSDGVDMSFEIGGLSGCIKFKSSGSDSINFPYPSIGANYFYATNGESFTIYKFNRSSGVYEWRLRNVFGNFTRVGEIVPIESTSRQGALILFGQPVNVNQYARLFDYFKNYFSGYTLASFDTTSDTERLKFSDRGTGGNIDNFHIANFFNCILYNRNGGWSIGDSEDNEIQNGSSFTLYGRVVNNYIIY